MRTTAPIGSWLPKSVSAGVAPSTTRRDFERSSWSDQSTPRSSPAPVTAKYASEVPMTVVEAFWSPKMIWALVVERGATACTLVASRAEGDERGGGVVRGGAAL